MPIGNKISRPMTTANTPELERHRNPGKDHLDNRLVASQRRAQVPLKHLANPATILHVYRHIQTEAALNGRTVHDTGLGPHFSDYFVDGVTGNQANKQEDQARHDEEVRDQQQQSSDDVGAQGGLLSERRTGWAGG